MTTDYKTLFALAADGIVVSDAAHRVVDVNAAFARMVGRTREEIIGLDPSTFIAPADIHERPARTGELEQQGELRSLRQLLHADGSSVPVEIHATSMPDGTYVGIVRRVRELQLAAALHSAETRLRVVGESLNVALVVTDADNRAVYANPQMAALTGYTVDELIGRAMGDFVVQDNERRDYHMRARREGHAGRYEVEHYRKDGSLFTALISGSPMHDAHGDFVGTVAVVEDITERRRIANEMAERELRYRSLFEVTPIPTWVFDLETLRFLAVNPSAVEHYGYSEAEFLGMTLLDIRTPEGAAEFREHMSGPTRPPITPRSEHRKKDGTIIQVALVGEDFLLEGRPSRLIIARDITDELRLGERQQNVEQQMRLAQKMEAVGSLAGGVAHDFNNLLSVMLGAADALAHALPRESPLREDVRDIRESAERGAALTRQLLSLGRRDVYAPAFVNVNDVVNNVMQLLQRTIGPNIRTQVTCATHPVVVLADAGQLEQVLMNLAINARDAMPNGGEIRIETKTCTLDAEGAAPIGIGPGSYVCVDVSDDGIGMDDATRLRAFEPFFTTKGPNAGSGLGLSTAYGIVKQAGGDIALESAPGVGTRVVVYLPRSQGDVSVTEARRSSEHRMVGLRGRVLLVEDDPRVRAQAHRLLGRSGFSVTQAEDGAQGLSTFRGSPDAFDIVVSDVMMPIMGGVEMVNALRQASPETPVVFVSGYTASDRELPLDARTLFVAKPYSIEALCTAMDSLIAIKFKP